ncbi:MAG TPA: orotidine-5'-phosphate decarboxylase [Gemmatimonadales bacterium]|nr:orotidine-5'-phosphate decarboxylase [Gemmatimonadales bacterium]
MAELIVAFDVGSGREALALAARLPGLRWAKIGPGLFLRAGPDLVREFVARGVQVFLDFKWHDIPTAVARAVTAARELGAHMATVHALGGPAVLKAAAAATGAADGAQGRRAGDGAALALVGVTVLTSHDASEFERVVGRGVPDLGLEAERLARLAVAAGLAGVVAAGTEVGLLRAALGQAPWIVVPGIRAPGEAAGDQARTIAAPDAVARGATHLVVGRPIIQATDPAGVYQRLVESL